MRIEKLIKYIMKQVHPITSLLCVVITITGIILIITGDITNGLLAMILAEVGAIPKLEK
jgi:hypothetical protein